MKKSLAKDLEQSGRAGKVAAKVEEKVPEEKATPEINRPGKRPIKKTAKMETYT